MKKPLAALAFALLTASVAHADTNTPGYDRPAPEQGQKDGHAHLVYWSDNFDSMSVAMQDLADSHSTAEMITKGDPHGQQEHTQGKGKGMRQKD